MSRITWACCALLCVGVLVPQRAVGVGKVLPWDWAEKKVAFYDSITKELIERYQAYRTLGDLAKKLDNEYRKNPQNDNDITKLFTDMQGSTTGLLGYLGFNPDKMKQAWDSIKSLKVIDAIPEKISFETLRQKSSTEKVVLPANIKLENCMLEAIKMADKDYEKNLELAKPRILDKQENAEDREKVFKKDAQYLLKFIAAQKAIDGIAKCDGKAPDCLLQALQAFEKTLEPAYTSIRAWYLQFDDNGKQKVVDDFEATKKNLIEKLNNTNSLEDLCKSRFIIFCKISITYENIKRFAKQTIPYEKTEYVIPLVNKYVLEEFDSAIKKIKTFKLINGRKDIDKLISDIATTAEIVALFGEGHAKNYQKYLNEESRKPQIETIILDYKFSNKIIYDIEIARFERGYDKNKTATTINTICTPMRLRATAIFTKKFALISDFMTIYNEAFATTNPKQQTNLLRQAKESLTIMESSLKAGLTELLIATQVLDAEDLKRMGNAIKDSYDKTEFSTPVKAYYNAGIEAINTKPSAKALKDVIQQIYDTNFSQVLKPYQDALKDIKTSPMFKVTQTALASIKKFSALFVEFRRTPLPDLANKLLAQLENVKSAILLVAETTTKTRTEFGDAQLKILANTVKSINKQISQIKTEKQGENAEIYFSLRLALYNSKIDALSLKSKETITKNLEAVLKPIKEAIEKRSTVDILPIITYEESVFELHRNAPSEDISDNEAKKIEEKIENIKKTEEETEAPEFSLEFEQAIPIHKEIEQTIPIKKPIPPEVKLAQTLRDMLPRKS